MLAARQNRRRLGAGVYGAIPRIQTFHSFRCWRRTKTAPVFFQLAGVLRYRREALIAMNTQTAVLPGRPCHTVRAPTASGVSRVAKSCGSFFPRPLEFADRSWDEACPAPPCATHDAPETGKRPKLPPSAPSAAPAPPESATTPTLHPIALVPPKAAGTPVPLLRTSACVAFRPNPGGYRRRCRAAAGTRTGVAARSVVQHLTPAPSALARRLTPLGATPPRLAGVPGCPGFAAQPAARM